MESTLSSARVATRNEAKQPLFYIRGAVVPQNPVLASRKTHVLTENTQSSELSQSAKTRKPKALRFSELIVVVNEAKTPPARTHRVKHFYGSNRLEEPSPQHTHSTSPLPNEESISANSYTSSTDISPTPSYEPVTPRRESTSPSPEPTRSSTKRVTWKGEEDDSEMQKKKMKDFGQWICLGEKEFLKRPTRKTY
jgi:hypothetical protein